MSNSSKKHDTENKGVVYYSDFQVFNEIKRTNEGGLKT